MEQLFKSILDQDRAPIVVCDMKSTVVYMNPSAIARYKIDLTGKSIKKCRFIVDRFTRESKTLCPVLVNREKS